MWVTPNDLSVDKFEAGVQSQNNWSLTTFCPFSIQLGNLFVASIQLGNFCLPPLFNCATFYIFSIKLGNFCVSSFDWATFSFSPFNCVPFLWPLFNFAIFFLPAPFNWADDGRSLPACQQSNMSGSTKLLQKERQAKPCGEQNVVVVAVAYLLI